MTIAYVSGSDAQNGSSTTTATLSMGALQANDFCVCLVHIDCKTSGTIRTVSSISDGFNTWKLLGFTQSTLSGHAQRTEVWTTTNSHVGAISPVITISGSANCFTAEIAAYRGASGILDGLNWNTNYTGTAANPAITQTVSAAGAMTLTFMSSNSTSIGSGYISTGFTAPAGSGVSTGAFSACMQNYKLESSAGSDTEDFQSNVLTYGVAGSLTLLPTGSTIGPIAFKSRATTGGSSPLTTNTITQTVAAGDYLVLQLHMDCKASGTIRTGTVTDAQGNAWSLLGASESTLASHQQRTEIWGCRNSTFAGSLVITVALSGTANAWTAASQCFSGVKDLPIRDALSFVTNYSGTSQVSNLAQTVSIAGAFTLAMFSSNASVPSGPSGFTSADITTGILSENFTGYKNESSAGTDTFTFSASTYCCTAGLTLNPVIDFSGPSGTITTTLIRPSQTVNAKESMTGAVTTSLSGISQVLHAPENVTGDIGMTLRGISQSMPTKEIFTGTIVTNLETQAMMTITARTFEVFTGIIRTSLGPPNIAAAAEERFVGTIQTHLGTATGQTIGNVVQAKVIVQGPIEMSLGPINYTILGAKLGVPGDGKWYSYRYLDS